VRTAGSQGYRVLFLLPFPPRLDADHGGAKTIASLIHHLPSRHEVAALYLRSDGDLAPDEAMRARCSHLIGIDRPAGKEASAHGGVGPARTVVSAVRQVSGMISGRPPWATRWRVHRFEAEARRLAMAWRPDVIQAEFSIMGQYLEPLSELGIPRILTVHEPGIVASEHRRARSRGSRRAWASVDHRLWATYEGRILGFTDAVVAFTEEDLSALRALPGGSHETRFTRIPFGVTVPDPLPPRRPDEPPLLLFVGNYRHPPNVDAARRLVTEILPAVRRTVPGARLRLVGPNLPGDLLPSEADGVEATGYVSDLSPHFQEASVIVAPLRMGGGMRVKVLEAMAAGRPLVASRLAVAGLEVRGGEHVLLGESSREVSEAIVHLLEHPEEAEEVGRAGRAWVSRHATWNSSAARYEELYESLAPHA
jgi:polysaccharide biosynthesis protein PslH